MKTDEERHMRKCQKILGAGHGKTGRINATDPLYITDPRDTRVVALRGWAAGMLDQMAAVNKCGVGEMNMRIIKAAHAASAGVLAVLLGAMFAEHCF